MPAIEIRALEIATVEERIIYETEWQHHFIFYDGSFFFLSYTFFENKFVEVTLVNNIEISGIQHYNSLSVYSITCSPHKG